MEGLIIFAVFLAALAFFYFLMRAAGYYWGRYQEQVVGETSKNMADFFLVMSPETILRLALSAAVLMLVFLTAAFNILFGLIGFVSGFFLPRLMLLRFKRQRHARFEQQFAEGLETIANALKTGYSLPQALDLLVREGNPPISQEFALVMRDYRLGTPVDQALENLTRRIRSENLELVVNAVRTLRRTGGNLVEVFEHISHVISERQRVQGRIDVLTAQGKMEALVIGLIPFFLLLVINMIAPEMVEPLFTTVIGWAMLLLVVVLDAIGIILIMKIVNIEI